MDTAEALVFNKDQVMNIMEAAELDMVIETVMPAIVTTIAILRTVIMQTAIKDTAEDTMTVISIRTIKRSGL